MLSSYIYDIIFYVIAKCYALDISEKKYWSSYFNLLLSFQIRLAMWSTHVYSQPHIGCSSLQIIEAELLTIVVKPLKFHSCI